MKQLTKRFKNKSKKSKTMRSIKYGGMKRSASNAGITKSVRPMSVRHKSSSRKGSTTFKIKEQDKRALENRRNEEER